MRDLLAGEGRKIGRRHVTTLMKRMGDRGVSIAVPVRRSPSLAIRSIHICCAVWRSRDRTRFGDGHHVHPNGAVASYLGVVLDWFSRRVLSWRVSITMEAAFCVEALQEALAKHGKPETFNTDQGSQFTGAAFTGVLIKNGIAISMDGRGAWRDNVFVERLWRSVKYEEVYLKAYDGVSEARASIGRYLDFYNSARWSTAGATHPTCTTY